MLRIKTYVINCFNSYERQKGRSLKLLTCFFLNYTLSPMFILTILTKYFSFAPEDNFHFLKNQFIPEMPLNRELCLLPLIESHLLPFSNNLKGKLTISFSL